MEEPTVNDVYDNALERIIAMRKRFAHEDAIEDARHPNPYDYFCRKCEHRHLRVSKIGRAHVDQGLRLITMSEAQTASTA